MWPCVRQPGPPQGRRRRRRRLDTFVGHDQAALVFTGSRGGVLRRGNFRRGSGWAKAAAEVGVPGLHFHDLRHTGNTLAAQTGVSLADLKARMGHDSVRAAMIYQHATSAADRRIADALDQMLGQPDATKEAPQRRPRVASGGAEWHVNGTPPPVVAYGEGVLPGGA